MRVKLMFARIFLPTDAQKLKINWLNNKKAPLFREAFRVSNGARTHDP